MVRSTSRILTMFAFILLSSALVASADPVIPIFNTSDGTTAGTLTATRTNNVSPGWDEIDLNFASWTATYGGPSATVITVIEGTWSGVGGNLGVSALGGTDWVARTTNANNDTLPRVVRQLRQCRFCQRPELVCARPWLRGLVRLVYVDKRGE